MSAPRWLYGRRAGYPSVGLKCGTTPRYGSFERKGFRFVPSPRWLGLALRLYNNRWPQECAIRDGHILKMAKGDQMYERAFDFHRKNAHKLPKLKPCPKCGDELQYGDARFVSCMSSRCSFTQEIKRAYKARK